MPMTADQYIYAKWWFYASVMEIRGTKGTSKKRPVKIYRYHHTSTLFLAFEDTGEIIESWEHPDIESFTSYCIGHRIEFIHPVTPPVTHPVTHPVNT